MLRVAIRQQVAERMRTEKRLTYEEVLVLSPLSAALRNELHYSIRAEHLHGNDLLPARSEVGEMLLAHLCAVAVTHLAVAPGEQVFQAKMKQAFMYIVIGGTLECDSVQLVQAVPHQDLLGRPSRDCGHAHM